ncbi:hypothetical protein Efla_005718 [Eimeria flavescens]
MEGMLSAGPLGGFAADRRDAAFMLRGSVLSPADSLQVTRQQQQEAVSEDDSNIPTRKITLPQAETVYLLSFKGKKTEPRCHKLVLSSLVLSDERQQQLPQPLSFRMGEAARGLPAAPPQQPAPDRSAAAAAAEPGRRLLQNSSNIFMQQPE